MNPIAQAARSALRAKDIRPPWQWIEQNVRVKNSPFGNRPNFELTPWLKEPSEVFADNRRHQITLQCCVQGCKTFYVLTHGIWALCENPGPLAIYVQTNEHVNKLSRGRWMPMIENSPLAQRIKPGDRHAKGISECYFDHTFAYVLAANESNAQSLSLRYVFADECAIWTPGILGETHKRATQWWNRRILNASTAGDKDSDFDKCFLAGDRRERRMKCPECGHLQVPEVQKHLRWPTNEITKPGGKWKFDKVKELTRFVCEHCQAAFPHTEDIARKMNSGGDYLVTNSNAPFDQVSFRWNAMVLSPSVLSWGDLAVEFIQAAQSWKAGFQEPMREFVRKREARTYSPRSVNPFDQMPVIEVESAPAKTEAGRPRFWDLQDHIFLSADVQMDHFWVLAQAWSNKGDERTLIYKKVYNWSDIAELQQQFGVADEDVLIDWSHRPHEVVTQCALHGRVAQHKGKPFWLSWKAFRGSDEYQFIYRTQSGRRIPLPYSWPPQTGDPSVGLRSDDPRRKDFFVNMPKAGPIIRKFCPIVTWSNPSIKDIVLARAEGRVKDVKIETVKGDWNAEYFRQIFSQKKELVHGKYGAGRWKYISVNPDDHALDCRCQIAVRAIQRGLLLDIGIGTEANEGNEGGSESRL